MAYEASVPVKMASLEATVTRADGRVENLGVISYWHHRRVCRWWFWLESYARRQRVALEAKG